MSDSLSTVKSHSAIQEAMDNAKADIRKNKALYMLQDSPEEGQNELKDLAETWYTKDEMRKMSMEITDLDNILGRTPSHEKQQYNLTRVKINNEEEKQESSLQQKNRR